MNLTAPVCRSNNLRGVLDHARRAGVHSCSIYGDSDGGAILSVWFGDRTRVRLSFADYTVAVRWVQARRSWDLIQTSDWGHGKQRTWSRHPGSAKLAS